MLRKVVASLLAIGLVTVVSAKQASEKIDTAINAKIRKEGMEHSKIMWIEHMLTDVYGPRLTGSPNHEAAAKWTVDTMTSWGMKNGHLEGWDYGRDGWQNEKASGHIVAPATMKDNLVFEVLSWTPSTNGTIVAPAVQMEIPQNPTEAELKDYFTKMAPKVASGIVLVGPWVAPVFREVEPAKRRNDDQVKAQYNPDPNAPPAAGRGAGRGGNPAAPAGGGRGAGANQPREGALPAAQVQTLVDQFLIDNHVGVRINMATGANQHGIIVAFNHRAYDVTKTVPTVVLRNEDYGRIWRTLSDGTPITLEFNIVNRSYPLGRQSYNAIAEIPGTDKKDEVVMLGGHLDSWHSATGGTDNAIGCAIMMEATRILQAIGAKPRRTIRVALWSGEEQGLLGSRAYVQQHFGSFENPKEPEYSKFMAYWNIDSGTGLVRGAGVFGPPEAAKVIAQFLKPWEDFKVYGASAGSSRNPGGTDSTNFNAAGLPGIGGSQDSIEYGSHTHHTNLDTYERILPDDVMKNATMTASLIYHLAMRDQLLPRFTKETMPPPPGGRGGAPAGNDR
jgi:carboxypeptidase Q